MQAPAASGISPPSKGWRIYETAGAILVLGIGGLTAIDVVGRYFLGQPVKGSFDLIEVLMALSVFWFMPLISRDDGHISLSLIKSRPDCALDRLRRVAIELFCTVASAIVGWQLVRSALGAMRQGEASLIIGIPKGPIIAVCAAIGVLMALAHLARFVTMLRGGKAGTP